MKKTFLLSLIMLFLSGLAFSQQMKYQLSSHILDITQGKPAQNVKIRLDKRINNQWVFVDEKTTDEKWEN